MKLIFSTSKVIHKKWKPNNDIKHLINFYTNRVDSDLLKQRRFSIEKNMSGFYNQKTKYDHLSAIDIVIKNLGL